ncbi:hypothetical protein C0J52_24671 [Blattella germanica]|nr:hypothetical protein C0J52_24671 [Blattella germanica]
MPRWVKYLLHTVQLTIVEVEETGDVEVDGATLKGIIENENLRQSVMSCGDMSRARLARRRRIDIKLYDDVQITTTSTNSLGGDLRLTQLMAGSLRYTAISILDQLQADPQTSQLCT